MKKSWREKYDARKEAVVEEIQKPMLGMKPGQKILISTPAAIEAALNQVPMGTTITVADLRSNLAQSHSADATCPLTTGIFLRIVAEKGLEEGNPAPFWRVVDPGSPLAKKLSCGSDWIAEKRREEAQKS